MLQTQIVIHFSTEAKFQTKQCLHFVQDLVHKYKVLVCELFHQDFLVAERPDIGYYIHQVVLFNNNKSPTNKLRFQFSSPLLP